MKWETVMKHWVLLFILIVADFAWSAKPFPELPKQAGDGLCNYLEWVLNSPLTQRQRAEADVHVRRIQESKDAFEAEIIVDALAAFDDLRNHSDEEKAAFRNSVEDELFKILRVKYRNKPLAKWIADVNRNTHRVVVEGTPKLTQQALDSWLELVSFLHLEGLGTELTEELVQEHHHELLQHFDSLNEDQKRSLAEVPLAWAALRQSWKTKTPEAQKALQQQWKQALTDETNSKAEGHAMKHVALLSQIPNWL